MVDKNWFEELTFCRWYAVVDDLIGGYSISNVNKTTSNADHFKGEYDFASFIDRDVAQHMVDLHNAWWDQLVWSTYSDNLMATYDRELDEFYDYEASRKSFDDSYDIS